jgi:Family of unknown function (DUF6159)
VEAPTAILRRVMTRASVLMRASLRVMWAEQSLILLAVAPVLTFAAIVIAEALIASVAPTAAVALLVPAALGVVFASMFWSAAIVAAANEVAERRSPTVAGATMAAAKRWPAVCAWAYYAVTVGIVVRLLGALLRRFDVFATSVGETAWSVATMLVLPAIVIDGWTPADARRHSREMLSATWATSLTGQLGFDLVAAVAVVPALLVVVFAALLDNGPLMGIAILLCFASFIAAALAVSACLSVYRTMLYRHVNGRQLPLAFEASRTFQASVRPAPAAARTTIGFGSRPVRSR